MLSNVNCKLFLDAKENNSKKGKLMMKVGKQEEKEETTNFDS